MSSSGTHYETRYQISIAAITNDHKFSGFKPTNVFSSFSGGQKPEMGLTGLRSTCGQGCILSGAARENLFPCLIHLLEVIYIPFVMVPSSIFKGSSTASSNLSPLTNVYILTSPSKTFLPSFYKDFCVYSSYSNNPGESPHIRILNLITSAKSLVPL